MALDSEIERVRKDTVLWRSIAEKVLRYGLSLERFGEGRGLTDWELDFLENILGREWPDGLSYLQAEKLLQIRDELVLVTEYRGHSVKWLQRTCYENRFYFDDDDDEAFVTEQHQSGRTAVRRREARRLWQLAQRAEGDWAA